MIDWYRPDPEDDPDSYRFVAPNLLLADLWFYDTTGQRFSEQAPHWTLSLTRWEPLGNMDGEMVTEQFELQAAPGSRFPAVWAQSKIEEFLGPAGMTLMRMHQTSVTDSPPRFTYYQTKNGPMFCYTTERDTTSADSDDKGWFYSFVFKATGPGSRKGKAEAWTLVTRSLSRHRKRKDASARAERLHEKWRTTGKLPV